MIDPSPLVVDVSWARIHLRMPVSPDCIVTLVAAPIRHLPPPNSQSPSAGTGGASAFGMTIVVEGTTIGNGSDRESADCHQKPVS
jgi:hypothetical protein